MFLGSFGKKSVIDYKFYFRYPKNIFVGKNVEINRGIHIFPSFKQKSRVVIGDNVVIAPNVYLLGAGQNPKKISLDVSGDIVIGTGVYIGANTTVRYGVTIGENSVIGAGSVVVSNIPSNSIAAGIPARVISKV